VNILSVFHLVTQINTIISTLLLSLLLTEYQEG